MESPPDRTTSMMFVFESAKTDETSILDGAHTDVTFRQPENAVLATFVTLAGIVTDVNSPPKNAYAPTSVAPSGIANDSPTFTPST